MHPSDLLEPVELGQILRKQDQVHELGRLDVVGDRVFDLFQSLQRLFGQLLDVLCRHLLQPCKRQPWLLQQRKRVQDMGQRQLRLVIGVIDKFVDLPVSVPRLLDFVLAELHCELLRPDLHRRLLLRPGHLQDNRL